jgi:succinate dehydrogenase hydrophobic anchor subunit
MPSATIPASVTPVAERPVQLFTIAFNHPIEFGIAVTLVLAIVLTAMFSALSAEGSKRAWVRAITSSNARFFFGLLFVVWCVVFGIGLQLVPHEGASSPYGALGLIALFTGFFIMMGFLWSVIGE